MHKGNEIVSSNGEEASQYFSCWVAEYLLSN